jgi:hypothetical protein
MPKNRTPGEGRTSLAQQILILLRGSPRGLTLEEIATALHIPDEDEVHRAIHHLLATDRIRVSTHWRAVATAGA